MFPSPGAGVNRAPERACRADQTLAWPTKTHRCRRSLLAIGIEAKPCLDRVLRMGRVPFCTLWPEADIRSFAWEEK